ncbi:MAG: glutathione S-transferase [Alphaproteobacteria bacterium]|nr:glutathione S-transferase [Alphaproteobacteria bacterium]
MKLYYTPGACSLADHIAMHEAGMDFELDRVDLKTKTTESGGDFTAINPKGYVPAVVLDNGQLLTENVAILDWVADQNSALRPDGALGRTQLVEALAFISTEIHKRFSPFFQGGSDEEKSKNGAMITKRLQHLADTMKGDYLFGAKPSSADAYLFVMLMWAGMVGVPVPDGLNGFRERMQGRESVQTALKHEGLA